MSFFFHCRFSASLIWRFAVVCGGARFRKSTCTRSTRTGPKAEGFGAFSRFGPAPFLNLIYEMVLNTGCWHACPCPSRRQRGHTLTSSFTMQYIKKAVAYHLYAVSRISYHSSSTNIDRDPCSIEVALGHSILACASILVERVAPASSNVHNGFL